MHTRKGTYGCFCYVYYPSVKPEKARCFLSLFFSFFPSLYFYGTYIKIGRGTTAVHVTLSFLHQFLGLSFSSLLVLYLIWDFVGLRYVVTGSVGLMHIRCACKVSQVMRVWREGRIYWPLSPFLRDSKWRKERLTQERKKDVTWLPHRKWIVI